MKKAEVFVAESPSGIILNKVGKKAVWKRGDYELTENQKVYSLKKGNVVAYKQ